MDKVLSATPAAAEQYRSQITKSLQGNPTEARRARVAARKLLCDEIKRLPPRAALPLQPGVASLLVELSVAEQGTCLKQRRLPPLATLSFRVAAFAIRHVTH